jgi:glycosyltransferase involved in cell wall biosynthesis
MGEMISVIMPTYNRAYIIERAIKSIINQTYHDWELIIVDDASEDNTSEVVKKYINEKIHYYSYNTNKGANYARNYGVKMASGKWITFLDSDNYWPEHRLKHQVSKINNITCDRFFLYGKVSIKDENDFTNIVPNHMLTKEELKYNELRYNVIDLNTILISRQNFIEVGGLDVEMPRFQDWELVLRLLYTYNFEAVPCDELYSINIRQTNSISRDDKCYMKAKKMILDKYLYLYLPKDEIIGVLTEILRYCTTKMEEEELASYFNEIAQDYPDLFYYTINNLLKQNKKYLTNLDMINIIYQWKQKNIARKGTIFSNYFYEGSKYKTIAIYGLGNLARLFVQEVKELPVTIKYGIDRQKKDFDDIKVVDILDRLENVDLFIVTVSYGAQELKENLTKMGHNNVYTLREMIENL